MFSRPSTASLQPDTVSQTALHICMTRSIHGEVSFINAITITAGTATIVANAPKSHVAIDRNPVSTQRTRRA